jgi:hypothetical protein
MIVRVRAKTEKCSTWNTFGWSHYENRLALHGVAHRCRNIGKAERQWLFWVDRALAREIAFGTAGGWSLFDRRYPSPSTDALASNRRLEPVDRVEVDPRNLIATYKE